MPSADTNDDGWQKENEYLRFLPYYDQVCVEADQQLSVIKAGFRSAIALREIKPGLNHWLYELEVYLKLYGMRLTKQDHIALVKSVYDIVLMPKLDLRAVKSYCRAVASLLSKVALLSRDDLCLDWRPLYDLFVHVNYEHLEEDSLSRMPDDMVATVGGLVKKCKPYFSVDSTAEMLAEFRPYICPWDVSNTRAWTCYAFFLPTALPESQALTHGYGLWFPELMYWWQLIQNATQTEPAQVRLMYELAKNNCGRIDWTPYLAEFFTRFLRSLDLSVGKGGYNVSTVMTDLQKLAYADLDMVSSLIVNFLGGPRVEGCAQGHITRMFQVLESYYYPSNVGKWMVKLFRFIDSVTSHFCQRVHRERHWHRRDTYWLNPTPVSHRLTDADIDDFVDAVLPSALSAIYAKRYSENAVNAIRSLSHLAPSKVVPQVLDRIYPALETLIEPHRLTQSLNALVAVVIPLNREPEFRLHVIPLLHGMLPGIDANDPHKAMVTFQAISLFSMLIPMCDKSATAFACSDLTDDDRDVISSMATLDTFIHAFMQRILQIIEMSGEAQHSNQTARYKAHASFSPEEMLLKSGMHACLRSILSHCSSDLYQVVLSRLFNFLSTTVLAGNVASKMVAELCFTTVRTNPRVSMAKLVPLISEQILEVLTPEVCDELEVNETVMWYLNIATEIVRCDGRVLVEHSQAWLDILDRVLLLKCKDSFDAQSLLLENLLGSLSGTYITTYEANRAELDSPASEYLPVRHWCEMISKEQCLEKADWHCPSKSECEFVQKLLDRYLQPLLARLDTPQSLTKEDVLHDLSLIRGVVSGAGTILPIFSTPLVELVNSQVAMHPFRYVAHCPLQTVCFDNGRNIRQAIYDTTHNVLVHLLSNVEDDTKSLVMLVRIFTQLMFHRGMYRQKFDRQTKVFQMSKRLLLDKVRGNKEVLRDVHYESAVITHYRRLLQRSGYYFTETHLAVINDFVTLSTSHYSEVRKQAQAMLEGCFTIFPYSYKLVLPKILDFLRPVDSVTHEQFKGALYVIYGTGRRLSLSVRADWEILSRIWPALIRAHHGEKPSVITLMDLIHDVVISYLESFQIEFSMPKSIVDNAICLWKNDPSVAWAVPSAAEIEQGAVIETKLSQTNLETYIKLAKTLTELGQSSDLHWRHMTMSQAFLSTLIRNDYLLPPCAIKLFCLMLTDDKQQMRKVAYSALSAILAIMKPKAKKVELTLRNDSEGQGPVPRWGVRADNAFMLYRSSEVPLMDEQKHDSLVVVDKTHLGFYVWPRKLLVNAAPKDQTVYSRTRDQMSAQELVILDMFSDTKYTDKFVTLILAEGKKDKEHFRVSLFQVFKFLFRNYGGVLVPNFEPRMRQLAQSEHDYEQRLVTEFMAGLTQGSKLWTYAQKQKTWPLIEFLVTTANTSVTSESLRDWGTSFATTFDSRDPQKLGPLIEMLFTNVLKPMESAFYFSSRFYFLQGGVAQQEWRMLEFWARMLEVCWKMSSQPYDSVRSRLGSCISGIFWFDLPGMVCDVPDVKIPDRTKFLNEYSKELELLWVEAETGNPAEDKNSPPVANGAVAIAANVPKTSHEQMIAKLKEAIPMKSNSTGGDSMEESSNWQESGEPLTPRKEAFLHFKTLLVIFAVQFGHTARSAPRDIVQFLPLLCYFENETSDDELKDSCHDAVLNMARTLHSKENISFLLDMCAKAASYKYWKARVTVLRFLQTCTVYNLFMFDKSQREFVRNLCLELLCDSRIEVQQAASETLSGLFHCGFLPIDDQMIKTFEKWIRDASSLMQKSKAAKKPPPTNGLGIVKQHAGVLGLAAVVQATPYSVPGYLPDVLMLLSDKTSAPQPVSGTIKKTLQEFKRTHVDSWHEHKEHFTDDQLVVLTELLVSPNYYV